MLIVITCFYAALAIQSNSQQTIQQAARGDVVIADFEGDEYNGWTVTGAAFGKGPAQGTLPNQMPVTGFAGKGLANSFVGGDGSTGRLLSPTFPISRRSLTLLIGGGGWAGKTCINLLVDGQVVRSATGSNTKPGGSEALERLNWDLSELQGKNAQIEIVDDATGWWGHINVDQIVLTDSPPPGLSDHPQRTISIKHHYLNLPVSHEAPLRRMSLEVEGKTIDDFEIAITHDKPDYWVFIDVSRWAGQQATLKAQRLPNDGAALAKVTPSDELLGSEPPYSETLRPQFHFSSRRGWLNDPNGMVFANGEYHLYYQHNPYGWSWGNMHWGHAVSPDMIHWKELPIGITPHAFDDWAYSGSAIVDADNTAGWRIGDEQVLVAAYTSTGRGECIVYSNDGGRTFTEYSGNPVVVHTSGEGRDPRLLWHAPTKRWVMAVYTEDRAAAGADRQGISFFTSSDLKKWTFQSRIGGFFECPDLFELPVDGNPQNTRWVLTAANSQYVLGQFDGARFTPDEPRQFHPGNLSDTFYAAQTFSHAPDGRRIQIGWARINMPGMPFNQMMSFPTDLTLHTTPRGLRVFVNPIPEIERLYQNAEKYSEQTILPDSPLRKPLPRKMWDVQLTLKAEPSAAAEIRLQGFSIQIDPDGTVSCAGRKVARPDGHGKFQLRALLDVVSLELFIDEGEFSMIIPAKMSGDGLEIHAQHGTVHLLNMQVHELKSAWPAATMPQPSGVR